MDRTRYILIVETDDLIRELFERWLGEAGYAVRACVPGDAVPRGLVIADVPSPQRGGAPIMVVSARFRRGLGVSVAAARELGVRRVLPKPFTREELLTAVRETIEDP